MNVLLFCFVFSLNFKNDNKKEVYKNLIKELIKLFNGHILLYILQSLSSLFANIEMCCVHKRNIDIVNSLNKLHRRKYSTVKSAPYVASVYM